MVMTSTHCTVGFRFSFSNMSQFAVIHKNSLHLFGAVLTTAITR